MTPLWPKQVEGAKLAGRQCNFLKGRDGDKINAILVGAGYNYRLVLKWLRILLARIMAAILKAIPLPPITPITHSP